MAILTMNRRIARGRAMLGLAMAWILWVGVLGFATPGTAAPTALSAEDKLKAVFLFNFAQFVEWPAPAFREPTTPLIIGVLGDDPFGAYLDELVRDEKVGNHPLLVQRYKRGDNFAECHIIFICHSESKELEKILAQLKDRSVLTVSDVDTFTHQGGMVRFTMENGKVRLRINVEAAKTGDLKISSKILRPGTIVTSAKD